MTFQNTPWVSDETALFQFVHIFKDLFVKMVKGNQGNELFLKNYVKIVLYYF